MFRFFVSFRGFFLAKELGAVDESKNERSLSVVICVYCKHNMPGCAFEAHWRLLLTEPANVQCSTWLTLMGIVFMPVML